MNFFSFFSVLIPIVTITGPQEDFTYTDQKQVFEIEEFGYVYDKLQELINEVQGLKENIREEISLITEWWHLLYAKDQHPVIPESTRQSTE